VSKKKVIGCVVAGATVAIAVTAKVMKNKAQKSTYKADVIAPVTPRKMGFYEKYIKRLMDITCATGAIVVFSPLYLGVALLVRTKLGSPVLFTQDRPGLIGPDGKETVFKMYKFRSMTDERDENGELLPDDVRLTKFGKWLRNTSLDELPEAFNILNGTMSVIGPRPQLVRDMVFMTDEQRMRHTAKPGLSGLAQVNGRNAISWEDKIDWDLKDFHVQLWLAGHEHTVLMRKQWDYFYEFQSGNLMHEGEYTRSTIMIGTYDPASYNGIVEVHEWDSDNGWFKMQNVGVHKEDYYAYELQNTKTMIDQIVSASHQNAGSPVRMEAELSAVPDKMEM